MTGRTRLVSLIDLGFGDSGKGLYTDYLTRSLGAHTVIRFNGGGQAGHNVCLPDGRHHTFSQFGAGSFVHGVRTLLAYPVVVHPTALLIEDEWLRRVGVHDALSRLHIDARCRVTTPFHQAAGRLRELLRGTQAHGTCGVGVGETVGHGLQHPELSLAFAELRMPARVQDKLDAIRRSLLASFDADPLASCADPRARDELAILRDSGVAARWLAQLAPLLAASCEVSHDAVGALVNAPGSIVFEGAQGMLLDEQHGFHPHTTWSSVGTSAVMAVAGDAGFSGQSIHLGVLRCYLTRHGAGPLPTHDVALDACEALAEPHNSGAGWQGAFRRGQPDAVLLRYAVAGAGVIDGLVATHHDVLSAHLPGGGLRWCSSYLSGGASVRELPVPSAPDIAHQSRLTQLLTAATPVYDTAPIADSETWCANVESVARRPVLLCSYGPSAAHVQARQVMPWARPQS